MSAAVHIGNVLDILPALPAESVNCVVTSPPYWGLRDYGVPGQLGLEPTPDEYVAKMVGVFREVRRVLRDDGTLWLNLGDSYSGSGKGAWDVTDVQKEVYVPKPGGLESQVPKVPPGLKPKDLVGIPWRVAFALQQPYEHVTIRDRVDRAWMAALLDGEGCITTTVAKPTTGLNESYAVVIQVRMSDRECLDRVVAITGMSRVQDEALPPSMADTGQRPVYCWKIAGENAATVLAEVYPYLRIKRRQAVAAWNLQRLKDGIVTRRGVPIPESNMEQRRELHRVIRALNQRELVDVPGWCREPSVRVDPGWYLRSDVIWAKPNPMPESVTDRPTKAHEYVFLMSKAARYFYDADAIREAHLWASDSRNDGERHTYADNAKHNQVDPKRQRTKTDCVAFHPLGRNRRTVWQIATQPYPEAHFATYPEKLVEPCILAGCPVGGTVLDPFTGSGTTGVVACRLGRDFVGIELNYEYAAMAERRIAPHRDQLQLAVTP